MQQQVPAEQLARFVESETRRVWERMRDIERNAMTMDVVDASLQIDLGGNKASAAYTSPDAEFKEFICMLPWDEFYRIVQTCGHALPPNDPHPPETCAEYLEQQILADEKIGEAARECRDKIKQKEEKGDPRGPCGAELDALKRDYYNRIIAELITNSSLFSQKLKNYCAGVFVRSRVFQSEENAAGHRTRYELYDNDPEADTKANSEVRAGVDSKSDTDSDTDTNMPDVESQACLFVAPAAPRRGMVRSSVAVKLESDAVEPPAKRPRLDANGSSANVVVKKEEQTVDLTDGDEVIDLVDIDLVDE